MWKVTLTSFIVGGISVRFFPAHVTVSFVLSQTQTRGHFAAWAAGTEVIRNRSRHDATISVMAETSSNCRTATGTDYYLHLTNSFRVLWTVLQVLYFFQPKHNIYFFLFLNSIGKFLHFDLWSQSAQFKLTQWHHISQWLQPLVNQW